MSYGDPNLGTDQNSQAFMVVDPKRVHLFDVPLLVDRTSEGSHKIVSAKIIVTNIIQMLLSALYVCECNHKHVYLIL